MKHKTAAEEVAVREKILDCIDGPTTVGMIAGKLCRSHPFIRRHLWSLVARKKVAVIFDNTQHQMVWVKQCS